MKALLLTALAVIACAGCTSDRLRRSTINQATTLTELQFQQVLNNLATFCDNPKTMPWHVNLRDGSAQVADVGSLTLGGDLTRTSKASPSLLGGRTVVEQWGMTPVTDDTELRILRVAYRRALGYQESLEDDGNDLANDLAHELKKQTPDFNEFQDQLDRTFSDGKTRRRNEEFKALADDASARGWPNTLSFLLFGDTSRVHDKVANILFPYTYDISFYENFVPNGFDAPQTGAYYKHLAKALSVVNEHIILENEMITDPDGNGGLENYVVDPKLHNEYTDEPVNLVTPFAAEIRRQVKDVQRDIVKIHPGWYHVGRKHDVPKDACYVGHYHDCYVWVCRDGVGDLTDFTLKILSFSSLLRDPSIMTTPGPRFTPASGFPTL